MRILVTGSREWSNQAAIDYALALAFAGEDTVIVHGDCPTGADRLAKEWAERFGVQQEAHPADGETHGKAAGPKRNQEMVDLGADVCLAFPLGESRGTRDCMRRASEAGIPVIDYDPAARHG